MVLMNLYNSNATLDINIFITLAFGKGELLYIANFINIINLIWLTFIKKPKIIVRIILLFGIMFNFAFTSIFIAQILALSHSELSTNLILKFSSVLLASSIIITLSTIIVPDEMK